MPEIQHQKLAAGLTGRLEQHQLLSHNLRRSLELLALPVTRLESRISTELESNPMLELPEFTDLQAELPPSESHTPEDENDYENNSVLAEEWSDDLPLPQNASPEDERRDFIGSLPAPPPPLRTQLLEELTAMNLPENFLRAAQEIVSAIDDNGFLTTPPADLAMLCDVDMSEITDALHLVQQISPPGVAARDLPECLKLQLERSGKMTPQLAKLLECGLDDLEKNRLDHLAQKLDTDIAGVEKLIKILRSLNPAPGKVNSPGNPVIIPDLVITRTDDGDYICSVNRTPSSRITISKLYEKLLEDDSLSADDRTFLTEKLTRAKELMQSLAMRESTLKQLGDLLITHQRDFFDHGTAALKSLTMKTAAAALDVSESTISRAVADKFASTPHGTLPLKFFFSSGYDSPDGSEISNQAVMEKIRSLIAQEDPASPLSDDAIAKLLKQDGLSIARRTVAKYRDIMKIPSSSLRKKFS